jgi:frataxin-like iron-binding protein CyaY
MVWFGLVGTLNPKSGYNFKTIVGRWVSSREEMQLLSTS